MALRDEPENPRVLALGFSLSSMELLPQFL